MKSSLPSVCTGKVGTAVSVGRTSLHSDLFRFRCIPGLTVTTDHFLIYDDCRYDIVSVEDVKGRGMYIEVLAKKEVPTVG